MATFEIMNVAAKELGEWKLRMGSDTFKAAFLTNDSSIDVADANPLYSTYSSDEVSSGGNYSAGGITLTGVSWTEYSGTSTWKADKITLMKNANNPTNIRVVMIYDTTASNRVVGFVRFSSDFDGTLTDVSFKPDNQDTDGAIMALKNNQ